METPACPGTKRHTSCAVVTTGSWPSDSVSVPDFRRLPLSKATRHVLASRPTDTGLAGDVERDKRHMTTSHERGRSVSA